MSKTIQIRNVPDSVHRRILARAARAGLSVSEYVLRELGVSMETPDHADLRKQLAAQSRVRLKSSIVEILREERSAR